MKKIYALLVLAFALIAGPSFSQTRLSFGVSGGMLYTSITNQNNYGLKEMDYKLTFGPTGSVNIGLDFNKSIGLVLQVGYAVLGQKYTDSYGDTTLARNIRLNYLQIPLMFKYRTHGNVARFYLMAGPQLNYLLSATQTYTLNGSPFGLIQVNPLTNKPYSVSEATITERFNSIDIAGRLDLGVEISLMKHLWLNAGMTLGYGFTDINNTDWHLQDHSGAYHPSHNVTIGLNVGINYNL